MDFINLITQNCDFVSSNYDFVFVTIHLYILQSGLISNLKFGLRSTSLFFFLLWDENIVLETEGIHLLFCCMVWSLLPLPAWVLLWVFKYTDKLCKLSSPPNIYYKP